MKRFIEEFRAFAIRGNMLDMAVGAFIATAFSGLVSALTDDLINPLINMVTGAAFYGFGEWMGFGANFVSALINFLIKAFALFCLLKALNKAAEFGKKKEAEPAVPAVKLCPYCRTEIPSAATRCPHCTSMLSEAEAAAAEPKERKTERKTGLYE